MPVLGFDDVTLTSEHRSLQRHLAALLTGRQIERRYTEGIQPERPFILLSMVRTDADPHNSYVAFPRTDFIAVYYAASFEDAQQVMEIFASLGYKNNRAQVWDYDTDPETPAPLGTYKLRISDVSVELVSDAEDDRLYNVTCSLTVEGKRSLDKYEGEVLDSISIVTEPQD